MAKRKNRPFGEPPAKHREAFTAYADLDLIGKSLREARTFIAQGKCRQAFPLVDDVRASITAVGVHSLGFALTKAQKTQLDYWRAQVRELTGHFGRNCVCDKGE